MNPCLTAVINSNRVFARSETRADQEMSLSKQRCSLGNRTTGRETEKL